MAPALALQLVRHPALRCPDFPLRTSNTGAALPAPWDQRTRSDDQAPKLRRAINLVRANGASLRCPIVIRAGTTLTPEQRLIWNSGSLERTLTRTEECLCGFAVRRIRRVACPSHEKPEARTLVSSVLAGLKGAPARNQPGRSNALRRHFPRRMHSPAEAKYLVRSSTVQQRIHV